MRQETVNIYQFSELSEEAKETARDWWRAGGLDYEWWDGVYETAKDAGAILGIDIEDIYFSGFWSQGDGACFVGQYEYKKGALTAIKKEFPTSKELHQIAADLQTVQKPAFYSLSAGVTHSGHYNHEYCTDIVVTDTRLDYYDDSATKDQSEGIEEALRDFMRWIYSMLESEYEYLNADEQVDDALIANGYEFNEDGTRY